MNNKKQTIEHLTCTMNITKYTMYVTQQYYMNNSGHITEHLKSLT
jgi:peptidyl-tRNA hydrolase